MKNIYVGAYTKALHSGQHATGEGISLCTFSATDGKLHFIRAFAESENPSYVCLSNDGKYLAACNEKEADCAIDIYKVETDGGLKHQSRRLIRGIACCHVAFAPDDRFVVASNYVSGNIVTVPMDTDGNLGEISSDIQLEGFGPNTSRQESAHAHSARILAAYGLLLVCDLGADKIMLFRHDEKGVLRPNTPAFVEVPGGSGPRHMEVSADNRFLYVTCELSCETAVFEFCHGTPVLRQMISTVTKGVEPRDLTADIHLHKESNSLYVSTRGKNILTWYRIKDDGTLELKNTFPCGGNGPRHFNILGDWLLCANQDSDNIAVFRISKTGELCLTEGSFSIGTPTCVCL